MSFLLRNSTHLEIPLKITLESSKYNAKTFKCSLFCSTTCCHFPHRGDVSCVHLTLSWGRMSALPPSFLKGVLH